MIKLSIVVVSLAERFESLSRLVKQLTQQPRFNECELIVIVDDRSERIGDKRNRAVEACKGSFIVHIDDDDEVDPKYLDLVLTEIDLWPHTDAFLIRGQCTSPGFHTVEFDYRQGLGPDEARWVGNTLWRTPGHLCPIRAGIAKAVSFTVPMHGEDLVWAADVHPWIKTVSRVGDRPLYFYRLAPEKAAGVAQMVHGKGAYVPVVAAPRRVVKFNSKLHENAFTPQYADRSGPGSTLTFARPYIDFLRDFIIDHEIKSLIDLGCGDMTIMSALMATLVPGRITEATFVDCIARRVELNKAAHPTLDFAHGDLRHAPLDADLIICKDVLQHWSTASIKDWLDSRLLAERDRFRFALITNCNYGETVNGDIITGGWRALDLIKSPFNVGALNPADVVFSWGDPTGGFKDVVLIKGRG